MKICLIGEYSYKQWCGSATNKIQRNILRELSKENDVVLFELPYPSDKFKHLFSPVQTFRINDCTIIKGGVANFSFYMIKEKYDVIHLMVGRNYMLFLFPFLLLIRAKIAFTLHDTIALRIKKINMEYILKRLLIFCSNVIFIYSKDDFKKAADYKKGNQIKILKNGVDTTIYIPEKENAKGRVITFAGGLGNPVKGLSFLAKVLSESSEEFELQICGENKRNLTHPDYIAELDEPLFIKQLQKSRVVIVPSEYESFSITALESLACGTPVIISTACGVSKYLKHKYDCLKFNYGDSKALLECLHLILNDEQLYRNLRNNGLKTAEKFNWRSIAGDYLKYYR